MGCCVISEPSTSAVLPTVTSIPRVKSWALCDCGPGVHAFLWENGEMKDLTKNDRSRL